MEEKKSIAKKKTETEEKTAKPIVNKEKTAVKTEKATPKKEKQAAAARKPAAEGQPASAKKTTKAKVAPASKNAQKSVLFVTSEAGPFIRSGGLGDVAEALPKALAAAGHDARVILPLYLEIADTYRKTMKYLGSVYVPLAWRYQYCGVFSLRNGDVTYYFLDNEYYFKRSGLYGHYDDAERFAFFSRACLEVLKLIDFYPDIIHANDWHTALVPVFLDAFYRDNPNCASIKTVFTIHNIEFQGKYGKDLIRDVLGLPEHTVSWVEYADCVNFMKGAIERANAVTTVSRSYANEIKDPYFAYGLETILNTRSYKLSGIINGIDEQLYDPQTDKALYQNYSLETFEDKVKNKLKLQEFLGLPESAETPMIGVVSRLTEQKGIDLIMRVLDDILAEDVQLVILGKGDWKYESALREAQTRYPGKLKVIINFSQDIASKIYAASDLFLMPSKFEPCGLSQMISMRYGTIPVVREIGGLKDTVEAYRSDTKTGSGFTFYAYNAYDMLDALHRALAALKNPEERAAIIQNAMHGDFSWNRSAGQYAELYERI